MPYKSAARFAQFSSALGGAIIEHTANFAREHNLPPMKQAGLDQMSAKIDDVAGELLMFGCDTWPESAATDGEEITHEAAASDVDPPRSALSCLVCVLASVAVSVPATMFLHHLLEFPLPGIFYVLTSLAAAFVFGRIHGLIVAGANAAGHNLVIVPPALTFTMPTESEVYVALCCAVLVVIVPWLASHAAKWRDRFFATSPNRSLAGY